MVSLNICRVIVDKYLNLGLFYSIKSVSFRLKVNNKEIILHICSVFYILILESELVSGFMTEHSAVIFVFFFLAEYASIVLICVLTSVLFLGGYLFNYQPLVHLLQFVDFDSYVIIVTRNNETFYNPFLEGLINGLTLGIKTIIMIFVFIWARASFPRIRFDQLMSFCWTILLPIVIAFIILIPCIIYCLNIIPVNISLF